MPRRGPRSALRALAQHAIQHCPHRLGISEAWRRDPQAEWRVVHTSCASCDALAKALGLTLEPAGVSAVATQKG